jgi:hypothetical protein
MIASVTKIRLKSWGEKMSGSPLMSVSPLAAAVDRGSFEHQVRLRSA